MESEDNGASWSQRNYASSGVSGAWKSVVYGTPSTGANAGQGVFVAVSSGTTTMYSLNKGYDWIAGGATTGENFVSVTYNSGIFVAVSENSGSMYSTDGITWTASAADSASAWRGVTYGGGKFVAVARSGTYRTMHSTDGMSWEYGDAIDSGWNAVTYAGDRYVSVSNSGDTMWSLYGNDPIDGTTLTLTDNTDLSDFLIGQPVTQDSVGTPETSAITNVTTTTLTYSDYAQVDFTEAASLALFDGDTATNTGNPVLDTGYKKVLYLAQALDIRPTAKISAYFQGEDRDVTLRVSWDDGSSNTYTASIPGVAGWVDFNVSGESGKLVSILELKVSTGQSSLWGVGVDDALLSDGVISTLTLTDDTDLGLFEVGDVVQLSGTGNPTWNETQDWSSLTGGGIPFAGDIEDRFGGDSSGSRDMTPLAGKTRTCAVTSD